MSIIFYEKHGCQNNRKQKQLLQSHGVPLEVKNIFEQDWTVERLKPFFIDKPVHLWFNPAAPRIKNGEVMPHRFNAETALIAMINDPFLIRRPLIQYQHFYISGFDWTLLCQLLPMLELDKLKDDIETCPNMLLKQPQAHNCGCQHSK